MRIRRRGACAHLLAQFFDGARLAGAARLDDAYAAFGLWRLCVRFLLLDERRQVIRGGADIWRVESGTQQAEIATRWACR